MQKRYTRICGPQLLVDVSSASVVRPFNAPLAFCVRAISINASSCFLVFKAFPPWLLGKLAQSEKGIADDHDTGEDRSVPTSENT
jgi:hypothetical protein